MKSKITLPSSSNNQKFKQITKQHKNNKKLSLNAKNLCNLNMINYNKKLRYDNIKRKNKIQSSKRLNFKLDRMNSERDSLCSTSATSSVSKFLINKKLQREQKNRKQDSHKQQNLNVFLNKKFKEQSYQNLNLINSNGRFQCFKKQFKEQEDRQCHQIRLKGLYNQKEKENFLLVDEQKFPKLFKCSTIQAQKLLEHECDDDYNSDKEQIQENKNLLLESLKEAIDNYVQNDPLEDIDNINILENTNNDQDQMEIDLENLQTQPNSTKSNTNNYNINKFIHNNDYNRELRKRDIKISNKNQFKI